MAYKNGFRVWDEEIDKEFYTPEEIEESDMRVALITAIVQARKEQGISQRQLGEMTGIKQPQIARIENGNANPTLETMIKMLVSLGKTLTVVPLAKN